MKFFYIFFFGKFLVYFKVYKEVEKDYGFLVRFQIIKKTILNLSNLFLKPDYVKYKKRTLPVAIKKILFYLKIIVSHFLIQKCIVEPLPPDKLIMQSII